MEENKDIQTKQETEVATSATTVTRRGHESPVDQSDLMIPRAKLLQALSPEVQEDGKRYQQGMIVNSITKDELPKDANGTITFLPVMRSVNWVRFNPQSDKDPDFNPDFGAGDVIWKSNDPKDPRVISEGGWGPENEPPKAIKFINYLAIIPGTTMPIVISFGKTSFKAGKALTTMTQFADGDLFAWRYKLRAKKEQNDAKQQYFVLSVESGGKAETSEYAQAERIYEAFSGKDLKVHDEDASDEAAPATKQPWE